jgi:hypothetical protein
MNTHLKTLLNVSEIARRNGRLPLARAGKVCVNTLMSRLVYPLNRALWPFDIRIPCQKLLRKLGRHAFPLCQQPALMMVP